MIIVHLWDDDLQEQPVMLGIIFLILNAILSAINVT